MTATTSTTIVVQIEPFCNCVGCIQKVKKTLREEVGGVKLLSMNPEIGKFTISTAKHPEVIKHVLKKIFPKKDILLSLEHSKQVPAFNNPSNLIIRDQNPVSLVTPADVHDIAKALVTMSHAKGLESMEFTQLSTLKINFTNREDQPSTSRSTLILNDFDPNDVHAKDDDCEYAPMPPPPPNTTKPSAPLIPATENLVYGYPAELYGARRRPKYDDPHGCCTIL